MHIFILFSLFFLIYYLSPFAFYRKGAFLVEMTGFEPAASASRTQRSTKLSHISKYLMAY